MDLTSTFFPPAKQCQRKHPPLVSNTISDVNANVSIKCDTKNDQNIIFDIKYFNALVLF